MSKYYLKEMNLGVDYKNEIVENFRAVIKKSTYDAISDTLMCDDDGNMFFMHGLISYLQREGVLKELNILYKDIVGINGFLCEIIDEIKPYIVERGYVIIHLDRDAGVILGLPTEPVVQYTDIISLNGEGTSIPTKEELKSYLDQGYVVLGDNFYLEADFPSVKNRYRLILALPAVPNIEYTDCAILNGPDVVDTARAWQGNSNLKNGYIPLIYRFNGLNKGNVLVLVKPLSPAPILSSVVGEVKSNLTIIIARFKPYITSNSPARLMALDGGNGILGFVHGDTKEYTDIQAFEGSPSVIVNNVRQYLLEDGWTVFGWEGTSLILALPVTPATPQYTDIIGLDGTPDTLNDIVKPYIVNNGYIVLRISSSGIILALPATPVNLYQNTICLHGTPEEVAPIMKTYITERGHSVIQFNDGYPKYSSRISGIIGKI